MPRACTSRAEFFFTSASRAEVTVVELTVCRFTVCPVVLVYTVVGPVGSLVLMFIVNILYDSDLACMTQI